MVILNSYGMSELTDPRLYYTYCVCMVNMTEVYILELYILLMYGSHETAVI